MKKYLIKVVTLCVTMAVLVCSVLCVNAAETELKLDFESGSLGFIAPGDLNADGSVSAEDLVIIRTILITSTKQAYADVYSEIGDNAKFSDSNGDGFVDIRDLIKTKKTVTRTLIENNGVNGGKGMNIYGNVAFSGGMSQMLEVDKYYKISFDYKADKTLKLTVNGFTNQVYIFETDAATNWTTKTYLIATAEEFVSTSDIEVQICGSGVVDNIAITPCTIDNDFADKW